MEPNILNEYRCGCGKLLFKGSLFTCALEIKCKRCGAIKALTYRDGAPAASYQYGSAAGIGIGVRNDGESKISKIPDAKNKVNVNDKKEI